MASDAKSMDSDRALTAALLKAKAEKEKEEELKQMQSKDKEAEFLAMVTHAPHPPPPPPHTHASALCLFACRYTSPPSCRAPTPSPTESLSARITGKMRRALAWCVCSHADCIGRQKGDIDGEDNGFLKR
jgi:hypothetical protein